jgi:hypothetical protein
VNRIYRAVENVTRSRFLVGVNEGVASGRHWDPSVFQNKEWFINRCGHRPLFLIIVCLLYEYAYYVLIIRLLYEYAYYMLII